LKSVIESYIGLWLIMLFLMLCIAFTSINMNVGQARTIYNSVRAEVQASNGAVLLDNDGNGRSDWFPDATVSDTNRDGVPDYFCYNSYEVVGGANFDTSGYRYKWEIVALNLDSGIDRADKETFEYNNIYQVKVTYEYVVPLFGKQIYPINGLAY